MLGMAALGPAVCRSAAANTAAGSASAPRRPNLVMILSDDHRNDMLGCAGHPILKTPNIDRLAAEGVRFAQASVTTPICCCSRAGVLTGMQMARHGVTNFVTPIRPTDWETSYPAQLRQAGYRTGFFGKFGVASDVAPAELFDAVEGAPYGPFLFDPADPDSPHADEIHTRAAEAFIKAHDAETPFCVSLSFCSPHALDYQKKPYQAAHAFDALYTDVTIPTPQERGAPDETVLLPFLRDGEGRRRFRHNFYGAERYQDSVKNYYRMISGVDAYVGRIRAQLEQSGFAENTVIIFMGDNGYFIGERGLEGKWLAYESSIRVPLVVYDPHLAAQHRGRVCLRDAHETDIAPTLLDYAGLARPQRVQGRSLRPLLDQSDTAADKPWFFQHLFVHDAIPRSEGVVDGNGSTSAGWMASRALKSCITSHRIRGKCATSLAMRNRPGGWPVIARCVNSF
jgi:arylsulfatase A-like enzyme